MHRFLIYRVHLLNVFNGDLALEVVRERVLMNVKSRQLQSHVVLQFRREPLLYHVRATLQGEGSRSD